MGAGRGEETPYNELYGEASPELRDTFYRLGVYKSVGISRVEANKKRVGKTVI